MKRFKEIENELLSQTRQLVRHYLPTIEQQLREMEGEAKANITIDVLFDEGDEGLQMLTTAKVKLPQRQGHSVKLAWDHGQLTLFGRSAADDEIPDVEEEAGEEEPTDEEKAERQRLIQEEGGDAPAADEENLDESEIEF